MYSGDMELTKKIIFLLVVVAVATAAKKESEAVSTSGVNYGDSALVTLMKTEVNCVKNQLAVCKSLLIRASQLCKISVFKDCKDAYAQNIRKSGVYTLNPDNGEPFQAYCDMNTDGGGWTVFQRRKDGSVDFYRGWNDYVKGFGNPDGEYWLGLEKIHRLTKASSVLRVDVTSYAKSSKYAKYSFKVGNAASKYTLQATSYSGNAGNSLGYHNGMKFSTKDNDNDKTGSNCAASYKGGWWFNGCAYSNLNGIYAGRRASSTTYCVWYHYDTWYSLKFAEMKIRRQY